MGVVYSATQLSLNRVVALKVLAAELSDDPGFRTRFQREGQLQAALDHEHIVAVYEAGQTEHGLFLAMRLIPGPTLKELIVTSQLDTRRSLRLLGQVAQALDSAHAAGLIHRDIKPQNILIGANDHAYLADFGLTKAPDDASRLTGTGQFIGTIDYVAPEQIQGLPATAASDCYSLTGVLYECLTGEVPFARPNEAATLHAHLTAPPPKVSERRPDLPPALDDVIAAGMAKDPAARTSSARELISAATRAVAAGSAGAPAGATRPSPMPAGDGGGQTTRAGGVATVASPAIAATAAAADSTRMAGAPVAPTATAATGAEAAPAAPPARAQPGRLSPAPIALVLVLAAVAVVGGFLVGGSGGTSNTSSVTLGSSATIGHLQLRYPSSWQLGSSAPGVPGVTFTNPIVLTPSRGGAELVAGEVGDATGSTLLPASFRAKLQGSVPAPASVTFGNLQAYRYADLRVSGLDAPVTLYAVPTSAGIATVACWGTVHLTPSFATQCSQVTATLKLLGASSYPLGPYAPYARLLRSTFNTLHSTTTTPLSQLKSATTPSGQSSAASRVATAYAASASALSRAAVSPMVRDAHKALTAALKQISTGYSNAASAAASSSGSAYSRAGQQINSGSAALSSALHQLSQLGYKVG
jgi:hypothetical protein